MGLIPLEAYFYCTKAGHEPVREWLRALSKNDKKILGEDIKTVQYGWPLGMPLVKNLGDALWEVRSNLESNKVARILFGMHQNKMVLLHGFVKKTQKTPAKDLWLAKKRMNEVKANV